jgi:cell division protein FtsL
MDNAVSYGGAINVARADRARKIELIRLVVPYLLAASLVLCSLFLFIWIRVSVITLNYEITDLAQKERVLARENRELTIQLDTVTSPKSLEKTGRERFGLIYPDNSAIVPVK